LLDEPVTLVGEATGSEVEVVGFRLAHDLRDGFAAAGWRRPRMYLDAEVRAGMSVFALTDQQVVREGLERLGRDLCTGTWYAKHGSVLKNEDLDAGYRFLRVPITT